MHRRSIPATPRQRTGISPACIWRSRRNATFSATTAIVSIIAATNHPEALIKSEHVKQGAIIVDDAQPSDVDEEIFINRKDVLALEGGVVHAPKINTHFNFGLKHKTDIFSCLAEAIILASLDHRSDFQVGTLLSVSKSDIDKISDAAKMLGFTVGHFQNDLRLYTDEDIEYVRNIVKNRYN
jgi:predicted amino acid dehydrogenase